MIGYEEAARLREQLLRVLDEDAHNAERLLARLDALTKETGIGAHAALLALLTRLPFDEAEAREHWERILEQREAWRRSVGRDVGLRVALLDYFLNENRRLVQPALVELELLEPAARGVDPRTGLAEPARFRAAVQQELRRAKRYGHPVSVVLFDLDDFHRANDRAGPVVGDRLLREAAILLHNKVRDIDLAARPGEDELALLLPQTDRAGAMLVAERYRREFEAHFRYREVGGESLSLTVSGGLATYPDDAASAEDLLARAAQALYQAKACGKNVTVPYEAERRRYLRFELEPGRFEVEVLGPRQLGRARPRNLSRSGVVFSSPEALEVGEEIELRLVEDAGELAPLRLRGWVVRLEELPHSGARAGEDRYDVGVAFDLDQGGGDALVDFLERVRAGRTGRVP